MTVFANCDRTVDFDYGPTLSASQAVEWLKKTATSKCSSLKKNNAEQFFDKFKILDENNYKLFYQEYNIIAEDRRGFSDYKLIMKSLNALDDATPEEAKSLRDAILFSVNTYITDSSNIVDLMGAGKALRIIKEKGLISYPSAEQIDEFDKELNKMGQDQIGKTQSDIQKYFPSDINFLNMKDGEMEAYLGYEGTKAMIERDREEYEATKQMAHKLQEFLGRNF